MSASTPEPAAELIDHAAGIIAAKKREPHTVPYHWAGALWEAGMLVAPGNATTAPTQTTPDGHTHCRPGMCDTCGWVSACGPPACPCRTDREGTQP